MMARPFAQPRTVSEEAHVIQRRWVALGEPAPDRRLADMDRVLIVPAKAAGLFSILDVLALPQHSAAAMRVNVANPAGALLTYFNSPTVVADGYWQGDGVASYIGSGFNPVTAAGKYKQEECSLFIRGLAHVASSSMTDIAISTVARIIGSFGASGTVNAQSANQTLVNADTKSSYGVTRRLDGKVYPFRNGVPQTGVTVASSALVSSEFNVLTRTSGSGLSSRPIGGFAIGGALSDQAIADLNTIVDAWLTYLGAI